MAIFIKEYQFYNKGELMHPGINGKKFPNKPALIMHGSGKVVTHGELNDLSNQGAQLFRSLGLVPGDSIAIMLENHFLYNHGNLYNHYAGKKNNVIRHGLLKHQILQHHLISTKHLH